MVRSLKLIAILAFASLAVTACGKRGALEAPGATDDTSEKKTSGKAKQESAKAKPEEHRGFVLDGLLR